MSSAEFAELLGRYRLLEPGQLEELACALPPPFPDAKALARELMERGWLTPYQVDQLYLGHGQDLVLGSYVLLERLGEGGMGQVFKARHRTLGRVVAVKLIRPERLKNPEAVKRFQREIRAAAQMEHPHIVRALDADEVGGTHLLVMDYVEGGTDLARLVKQNGPLPIKVACAYIRQAALGLQHASERGLVHRDIKPHNLLLAGVSNQQSGVKSSNRTSDPWPLTAVVKILDMGLARLDYPAGDDESTSTLTQEGAVMGTLDYMAPEQAMDSHHVDIRADLYSLGCTFYYLLTGRVPFPGGEALKKLLRHQTQEPEPFELLRPEVHPAVAAIVRKLMAKKPEDRFQTPAELAQALEQVERARALASPPADRIATAPLVANRPDSVFAHLMASDTNVSPLAKRLPEPVQRWPPWLLPAGGGVFLVLVVLLAILFGRGHEESQPKDQNQRTEYPNIKKEHTSGNAADLAEKKRLAEREAIFQKLCQEADAALKPLVFADAGTDTQALRKNLLAFRVKYPGTPAVLRAATLVMKLPSPLDKLHAAKIPQEVRFDGQPKELVAVLQGHSGPVRGLAFSPAGSRLLSGGGDKTMRWWDVENGRELSRFRGHTSTVWTVALSGDGQALSGSDDTFVRLWDVASGQEVRRFEGHTHNILSVAFSPDRRQALSSGGDHTLRLWDLQSGGEIRRLVGHGSWVTCLDFSPDGRRALSSSADKTIRLWDVQSGQELRRLEGHTDWVNSVAFSPDGRQGLSGSKDRTVRLWDLHGKGSQQPVTLPGHSGEVYATAFAPDGANLASSGHDGRVILWQAPSGKKLREWKLPGPVHGVAFASDGRHLATANANGTIYILRLAPLPRK